jgi:hypothetical protein
MDTFLATLGALSLLFSLAALVVAMARREEAPASKVKRLELDLVELADLVDQQALSIKKLHGRAATRAAREAKEIALIDPNDPMARLPGETGEQWKARMGRTLTGIRRN